MSPEKNLTTERRGCFATRSNPVNVSSRFRRGEFSAAVGRILGLAIFAACLVLALPAQAAVAQSARDDLNLIRGLLRDKLYDVAADRIFDFVFKYPGNAQREPILYEICDLLMVNGNEGKAVPLLRSYLQEFTNGRHSRDVTLMLAHALVRVGDRAGALGILRRIITDSNYSAAQTVAALTLLCDEYLAQERFDEVVSLLEANRRRRESSAELQLLYAKALKGLGQLESAAQILADVVGGGRSKSVRSAATVELASLFVAAARYQDCVQLVQRAGKDIEEHDELVLSLAISYYHLGDYREAYNTLAPLLHKQASAGSPASRLPLVLMSLQQWQEASGLLAASFASHPDTLRRRRTGLLLVEALINDCREEEAVKTLRALADGSSGDERGEILLRAAEIAPRPLQKLEVLDLLLGEELSDNLTAKALMLKARAYEDMGLYESALSALKEFKELAPPADPARAALLLGEILVRMSRFGEAEGELQRAVAADGDPPTVRRGLVLLIKCFYHSREWSKVADAYEELQSRARTPADAAPAGREASVALSMLGRYRDSFDALVVAPAGRDGEGATNWEGIMLSLARLAERESDRLLAGGIYERLTESDDQGVELQARIGLVALAFQSGVWESVAEQCRVLMSAAADSWITDWARYLLATSYERQGMLEQMRVELTMLAGAEPKGSFAAVALERLQELAVERGDFAEAVLANPLFDYLSPDAVYRSDRMLGGARSACRAGNYMDAKALYAAHPAPREMPPEHRFFYGKALVRTGEPAKAGELLDSIEPQLLTAVQQWERTQLLAEVALDAGDGNRAFTLFAELLVKPLDLGWKLEVLLGAAESANRIGRWPQAREHYLAYLEESKLVEPNLAQLQSVAEALATHGETSEAMLLYRRLSLLAETEEDAVAFSIQAATMLDLSGKPEEAAEEFLMLAYRHPDLGIWPSRARLKAAAIFERLERLESAERQYKVVAERNPGTDEARLAAQRLLAIRLKLEAVREERIRP